MSFVKTTNAPPERFFDNINSSKNQTEQNYHVLTARKNLYSSCLAGIYYPCLSNKSAHEKTALPTAFTLSTRQIHSSYIRIELIISGRADRNPRPYLARYPASLKLPSSSFTVLITSVSVAVEVRSSTCSAVAGAGPVGPVAPWLPASPAGP